MIESNEFPGYYEIPFANGSLINRSGNVIDKLTGRSLKSRLEPVQQAYTVNLKHNGRFIKSSLHRALASVFIEIPEHLKCLTGREIFVIPRDNEYRNIDIDNLMWAANKDYQKYINTTKRENALKLFGWCGDEELTECEFKPGFYWIPFVRHPVVINRDGIVFNLSKDRNVPVQVNSRGYCVISLWDESLQKHTSRRLHRVVARVFHRIPEKYHGLELSELQVNHKDGVKTNNAAANLEWCINEENMTHARNTGLFNNEMPVLVRDIRSNQVNTFSSISECGRVFNIDSASLHGHLHSVRSAGRISKDWHVFKLDNGYPWPILLMEEIEKDGYIWKCNVYVKELDTGNAFIFANYPHACKTLGLKFNTLKGHQQRNGTDAPFKGYRFELMDDSFDFGEE